MREACNWNTPKKTDGDKWSGLRNADNPASGGLTEQAKATGQAAQESRNTTGKPQGSLNSAWVMQLMGWPDEYSGGLSELIQEYEANALTQLMVVSRKSLPPGVTKRDCEWLETAGATRTH
jgi:hypothetical protein